LRLARVRCYLLTRMSTAAHVIADEVNQLADEYRDQCLWFLRRDFYPGTDAERRQILEHIMRHGDQRAFRRAAEVRRWLSQPSSAGSVGS